MASDDQFFEEEGDLASEPEVPQGKAARPASSAQAKQARTAAAGAAQKRTGKKPPSFGLVIAIAIVAVIFGYALGYLICLRTTSVQLAAQITEEYANLASGYDSSAHDGAVSFAASGASDAASESSTTLSVNEEAGLPEGHPDLSSMINDDGTVNEEAVAAYKAEQAAASQD